jgi:hypothetical protein
MDNIENKTDTINIDSINNDDNNGNSEEIDKNVPRITPDLNLNDNLDNDIIEDNKNNESLNYITKSNETTSINNINNVKDNNENEGNSDCENEENEESNGGSLSDIVPGSVGNKIKQFEIIQEEKKKESQTPEKIKRKSFRSRVDSLHMYKRESLALLASNPENKLRIQTVINQLSNNQNFNPIISPFSAPAAYRYSHLRNEISNNSVNNNNNDKNENSDENENKNRISEDESSNYSSTTSSHSRESSENENHIKYNLLKSKRSSSYKRHSLKLENRGIKYNIAKSQDSPLKITSSILGESDTSLEELNKLDEIKSPDSFSNKSSVQKNDSKTLQRALSLPINNNELEIDTSLDEHSPVKLELQENNSLSEIQINEIGIDNVKMVEKQFIPVVNENNPNSNINNKAVHMMDDDNCSSNLQDNIFNNDTNIGTHIRSASDDCSQHFDSKNQSVRVVNVTPLILNTKMISDTNLYKIKENNGTLSSKSYKSFTKVPMIFTKKQTVHKINRIPEKQYVKKKSSVSTIESQSDDSVNSSLSNASGSMNSSFINENRISRMNGYGYDADILYEYFDENSDNDSNITDSEEVSVQEMNNINNGIVNSKSVTLSVKTDLLINCPDIMSSEIATSTITPLDQLYNTISQELEERLCQTVRHSILERVDSQNYMVPINILYEKHCKNQVIFVERRMNIEEVLQQALNSINIYEDYSNYELLQIFGFEDIAEEENENRENNDENEPCSPTTDSKSRYQNVLGLDEKIQDILDNTINTTNRKSNNILTFRIRKKSSTMKIAVYFEEEKKFYNIMVTKTTTSADVIEALLFMRNEPYSDNDWYIQKKNLDNYEEGKEILEPVDILYNKDGKFKYILKKKKSKQMSKLASILGVANENDIHNIVESKDKKKKDKDKNKIMSDFVRMEPLKDNFDYLDNYTDEKEEKFSRILGLTKEELHIVYLRNKKLNEKKKLEAKKKSGSVDQLDLSSSSSNLKNGERFSSQVFNIFKSKKDKRISKLRDSYTGSMPQLSLSNDDYTNDYDDISKIVNFKNFNLF